MGPSRNLPLLLGFLLGGSAGQTGAVHDVGVQHLQQQVIQRHHIFHFHAVEVVHAFVAEMADVGEQHEQVSEAGVLLAEGEAGFGDGPHKSICYTIQQTQQPGTTLQLLAAL